MRPTDENQHSTRPNLMSSGRRGGNEESILAMLERDAGRGAGLRRSRLVVYGAGATVAVGLVVALVWLAREQSASDVIVAAEAPVAIVAEASPPRPAPHGAEATAQQPLPQAAMIVDEPQPPAKAAQQEVPPLVLLTPPQEAEHPSVATASATTAHPAESAQGPAAPDVRTAAAPERPPEARPAAAVTPHSETKRAAKTAAPARRESSTRVRSTAKPAETRVAGHHAAGRATPKAKKQPPPQQHVEKVDSDVALISAVIQHASNRANAAGGNCVGEANCAAKATPTE